MTDQLDDQIKSTFRRKADSVELIVPDFVNIGQRADSLRRRRSVSRASVAAAAVVLAAGVSVTGALYLHGGDTQQDVPTATDSPSDNSSSPSGDVTPSSTPTEPVETPDAQLLVQLAESPQVLQYLLGVTNPTGLVLCGMNKVGTAADTEGSTSKETLYIWLECGAYTTGDQAMLESGGADPIVVTVNTTTGHDVKIEAIQFPPIGYQPEDIRAMFPPDVAEQLIQGHLPVSPSQDERLQTASTSN